MGRPWGSRTMHGCGPCAGESLYAFWSSATESDHVRPNLVANSDSRRATGRVRLQDGNPIERCMVMGSRRDCHGGGPSRYGDGIEHYR